MNTYSQYLPLLFVLLVTACSQGRHAQQSLPAPVGITCSKGKPDSAAVMETIAANALRGWGKGGPVDPMNVNRIVDEGAIARWDRDVSLDVGPEIRKFWFFVDADRGRLVFDEAVVGRFRPPAGTLVLLHVAVRPRKARGQQHFWFEFMFDQGRPVCT